MRNPDANYHPTVAITGLNAHDNPGPGISVIRALRADPTFNGRIVGLAYDCWEPGVFARDLVDDVFLIPYPSKGVDALRLRLHEIHQLVGLDAIIPNLDAELPSFIALADELRDMGIGTMLPSREQLEWRAKANLCQLGTDADILVPAADVVLDITQLNNAGYRLGYPLVVKGPFYGATVARSSYEAVQAFYGHSAAWGLPIIAQQFHPGVEFNVCAVGDGEGGVIGALAMKKTYITDKGKGWAGIAIKDPECMRIAESFMAHTRWNGPCELELLKGYDGEFYLLEINPRFPAWVYLCAGAGMNLPSAVLRSALGERVEVMHDYRVGTLFARMAIEVIGQLSDLEAVAGAGQRVSDAMPLPPNAPMAMPTPLGVPFMPAESEMSMPSETDVLPIHN